MIGHTVTGCGHGQIDCLLTWTKNGNVVAYISYALFEDRPYIQNIKVDDAHLRQGIATALVLELQKRHPEQEIDWGMLTENGSALYNALTFVDVPSEQAKNFEKLERLKKRFKTFMEQASVQDEKESFATQTAAWCLERHIDCLEEDLVFAKPTKRLLVLPEQEEAA